MLHRRSLREKARKVLAKKYWPAFWVGLVVAFVSGGGVNFNFDQHNTKTCVDFSNIFGGNMFLMFALAAGFFFVVAALLVAIRILIGYPLEVGARRFYVRLAQKKAPQKFFAWAFDRKNYWPIVATMFLRGFYNTLWFFALIIPGIVKTYAYSLVPYILAENPNIGAKEAIALSNELTDGYKWEIFLLDLSFVGWYILGLLALFIGTFFVNPYFYATKAELYLVLRKDHLR